MCLMPVALAQTTSAGSFSPFSQFALGGGVSLMGVNMQAATNVSRHLNLRVSGNVFDYEVKDISTNGFNIDAKVNMAAVGASLDFYPFATHGLRFSPGVQFYNKNAVSAVVTVDGNTKFSLNDVDFYSSTTNPVQGTANIGLHTRNPAVTFTTGWGNMISRKGKHLSFPFEIGVAAVDTPAVDIVLNKGEVCDSTGIYCVNVATDTTVQANLKAEIDKYKKDLEPLKVYPILSFGIAYSFGIF